MRSAWESSLSYAPISFSCRDYDDRSPKAQERDHYSHMEQLSDFSSQVRQNGVGGALATTLHRYQRAALCKHFVYGTTSQSARSARLRLLRALCGARGDCLGVVIGAYESYGRMTRAALSHPQVAFGQLGTAASGSARQVSSVDRLFVTVSPTFNICLAKATCSVQLTKPVPFRPFHR